MPSESQTVPVLDKRLLKAHEAARYLGLRTDTIYKKARLRVLPSVKVGRALRFDILALDRFVEQHAVPARKS
jgi:excisionase family DNA binding protein